MNSTEVLNGPRQFANHAPRAVVVTSDGGVIEGESIDDDSADETDTSGRPAGETVRVPVSGGVLVYEREVHGKSLVGFESVTDWDDLGDAVAARGHSRSDVLHLPELDE